MDDQFSVLVSKVLAGEASAFEKQQLKQYLSESNEDSLLYDKLKEYWNADVQLNNSEKLSFEDSVLENLQLKSEKSSSVYKQIYYKIASIAAIALFIFSCGITFLYLSKPTEIFTYTAQSTPVEYVLADGTKVMLNKNSTLTFDSDFGKKRREIKLNGEAYFKVSKDKTRPFAVHTMGTTTEVLGTSFNVNADKKTGNVVTTLVEGSVRFKVNNREEILKPGDEIAYNTKTEKSELKQTDTQFNTAWVSGRFSYKNLKFAELASKLEHIYRIHINVQNSEIANHIVSASFLIEEPVEDILGALESGLNFNYKIIDSTHIIITHKQLKNQ